MRQPRYCYSSFALFGAGAGPPDALGDELLNNRNAGMRRKAENLVAPTPSARWRDRCRNSLALGLRAINHRASEEIRHALQQLVLAHPHAGIRKQAAGVLSHVMAKQYEWR